MQSLYDSFMMRRLNHNKNLFRFLYSANRILFEIEIANTADKNKLPSDYRFAFSIYSTKFEKQQMHLNIFWKNKQQQWMQTHLGKY